MSALWLKLLLFTSDEAVLEIIFFEDKGLFHFAKGTSVESLRKVYSSSVENSLSLIYMYLSSAMCISIS